MKKLLPLLFCVAILLPGCRREERTTIHYEPPETPAASQTQTSNTTNHADTQSVHASSKTTSSSTQNAMTKTKKTGATSASGIRIITAANQPTQSAAKTETPEVTLTQWPVDKLPDLAPTFADTQSGLNVVMDPAHSVDGHGSVKISANKSGLHRVPLYDLSGLKVVGPARIACRAKLMAGGMNGQVFLKLTGHTSTGEAGSVLNSLRGDTFPDWVNNEAVLFLEPGQTLQSIRLSMVIKGSGTVWLDTIRLYATNPPVAQH